MRGERGAGEGSGRASDQQLPEDGGVDVAQARVNQASDGRQRQAEAQIGTDDFGGGEVVRLIIARAPTAPAPAEENPISRIMPTVTRIPRTHGLPPITSGSIVMR